MEQSGPINYVGGVNIPLKRVYFLNGDDTEKKSACVESKQDYPSRLNAFKVKGSFFYV